MRLATLPARSPAGHVSPTESLIFSRQQACLPLSLGSCTVPSPLNSLGIRLLLTLE